jgi:hypothetical protein
MLLATLNCLIDILNTQYVRNTLSSFSPLRAAVAA